MSDTKYAIPKLPTAQNVMEDISNEFGVIKKNHHLKFVGDNVLTEAYSCYSHMNHLKTDIRKQMDLNVKLEELNKELVLNVENMKKQQ